MQKLEKILEEIDRYIAAYKKPPMGREVEGTVDLLEKCRSVIRKYMNGKDSNVPANDVWIPVDERLPEEKINPASQDFYEYQVTAKFGNVKDVRHYKYGNGHWWHGFGNVDKYVTAWRERPEPYRPEKEQERKENIRGGRFEKVE